MAIIANDALLLCAAAGGGKNQVILANGDISSWRYHVFNNILPTRYKTEEDEKIGSVLTASGVGGASGYVLETELDLDKTPWLHFRWRVDAAADGFDEKIRGGDDFAFRIYLAGALACVIIQCRLCVRSKAPAKLGKVLIQGSSTKPISMFLPAATHRLANGKRQPLISPNCGANYLIIKPISNLSA